MSVNEVKTPKAAVAFQVRGTGPPGSRTFCIGDEDHTLGNSLRHVLVENQKVEFAAYAVPHPSEPVVQLRVQTAVKNDPEYTASDALKEACETLKQQCTLVLETLQETMPEIKEDLVILEAKKEKMDDAEYDDAPEDDMDVQDDDQA